MLYLELLKPYVKGSINLSVKVKMGSDVCGIDYTVSGLCKDGTPLHFANEVFSSKGHIGATLAPSIRISVELFIQQSK